MMISEIPSVFQSKVRLAVVAALLTGPKSFKSPRRPTATSDDSWRSWRRSTSFLSKRASQAAASILPIL